MSDFSSSTSRQGQPVSKTAYVLNRLREDLRTGVLNPGEQLRQVEIAERYGVSPTPVREALRLLEADGSIQYSPHRGATVTELGRLELDDLYLVRSTLEALLARLAAERAAPDDVVEMRKFHEEMARQVGSASADELSRLNREFHFALLRLASPLITDHVIAPLWQRFLPPSQSQWRSEERNRLFIAEHARIIDALEAGDAIAVERAMATHLATAGRLRKEFRSDETQ